MLYYPELKGYKSEFLLKYVCLPNISGIYSDYLPFLRKKIKKSWFGQYLNFN